MPHQSLLPDTLSTCIPPIQHMLQALELAIHTTVLPRAVITVLPRVVVMVLPRVVIMALLRVVIMATAIPPRLRIFPDPLCHPRLQVTYRPVLRLTGSYMHSIHSHILLPPPSFPLFPSFPLLSSFPSFPLSPSFPLYPATPSTLIAGEMFSREIERAFGGLRSTAESIRSRQQTTSGSRIVPPTLTPLIGVFTCACVGG